MSNFFGVLARPISLRVAIKHASRMRSNYSSCFDFLGKTGLGSGAAIPFLMKLAWLIDALLFMFS